MREKKRGELFNSIRARGSSAEDEIGVTGRDGFPAREEARKNIRRYLRGRLLILSISALFLPVFACRYFFLRGVGGRERGNFRGIRKLAELNCREHTLLLGDSIRGIWLLCRVYELFSVEVRASMANFFAFFQGFVGCVERWEGG